MYNQTQGTKPLSAKELSYMSDSMKNQEILMKLCVQASSGQNQQLSQFFSMMANEAFNDFNELLSCMQQHINMQHQQPMQQQSMYQ
ncbi:hypothetical protein [Longirhabdus pacifica]|uniref:hypothetical protein n=1 Tax=Longirhabdus pacifica TaxID=2305227 RepID=UPI00100873D7|nr:hypothetical protein [Longirhabdus pacifica]